jgi:hypothetical protein
MSRILRGALSLAGVGALLVACASPTLPLPPPAYPDVGTEGLPAGQVELSSVNGAEPNAIIVIFNPDPNIPHDARVGGAQADGNGSWSTVVFANPGDTLEITQQEDDGQEISPYIEVMIP